MNRQAAIVAVARLLSPGAFDHEWADSRSQAYAREDAYEDAAAVIDAAAPHVKAEALREAAEELSALASGWNPSAGYIRGGMDVIARLSDRAERIERGEL